MARINDTFDCYGHHTTWCSGQDDPHDADSPYCEYMVGGVEGVAEPNWIRTQVWITTIAPFTHGTFTRREYDAVQRNRRGVQLSHQSDLGNGWTPETFINLPSGEARTLAALLVAAADISDGIDRFDRKIK